MVSCGLGRRDLVWCGVVVVWFGVVCYDVVWNGKL